MASKYGPPIDATRLRVLLDARGWRPADLARAIDVSGERMTKWLKWGQAIPGYDLARICDVLDVDPADLYGMKRDPTPSTRVRRLMSELPEDKRSLIVAIAESMTTPGQVPPVHAKAPPKTARRRKKN